MLFFEKLLDVIKERSDRMDFWPPLFWCSFLRTRNRQKSIRPLIDFLAAVYISKSCMFNVRQIKGENFRWKFFERYFHMSILVCWILAVCAERATKVCNCTACGNWRRVNTVSFHWKLWRLLSNRQSGKHFKKSHECLTNCAFIQVLRLIFLRARDVDYCYSKLAYLFKIKPRF